MNSPTVAIIANPMAGNGRARKIAMSAQQAIAAKGIATTLHQPTSLKELQQISLEVCAQESSVVLACGGDGTVHQVLQAVIPAGVTFGIIPAGTGNDIAWSLGFTRKANTALFEQLAASIHGNQSRMIDASLITHDEEQIWSLGVISAGFDSAINERANRMTFGRGTTRYIVALLAEMRPFKLHHYEVVMDDRRLSSSALLIAVGNGGCYGGGMRICPNASMTDGLLDITWVDKAPRRTILRIFPKIFSGRHVEHKLVHTYQAKKISIDSPDSMIYADGERIGPPPVTIEVIPQAIRVIAGVQQRPD